MKKLLILPIIFVCHLLFGQSPPATCTITRTSSDPTVSCSTVSFHVVATNNIGMAQNIVIEVFTPGISNITSLQTYTHSLISGTEHFNFDLGAVPASGSPGSTVSFDFSFNIDCSVIPSDLSIPGGVYTTSSVLSYQAISIGATLYTLALPNITTHYDWVNLYYAPVAPTAGLIQYSHLGEIITRSVRVNVGSSSSLVKDFNGVVQFQDDMSGSWSCNMGDATAVTMSIYDDVTGLIVGSSISGTETSFTSNIFNFPMPSPPITSKQYIVFTEVVLIVPDGSITCLEDCGSSHALKSELKIHWGCDALHDLLPSPCHTINVEAIVYKDLAQPYLQITEVPYTEGCLDATPGFVTHTKRITNSGSNAHDINVTLQTELDISTYLPSTEFIFDGSGEIIRAGAFSTVVGFTYPALGSYATLSTCAQALTLSGHGNPIQTATFNIPVLNHGDYFEITYKTYHCCPSDHDALVSNYNTPEYFDTWELSVKGLSECDDEANGIRNDWNTGPRMVHLTQRPIPGPSYLTGATFPDDCNLANTTIYHIQNLLFNEEDRTPPFPYRNAQLFEDIPGGPVHGTLRVTITTQAGLNIILSPPAISLQDEPSSVPVLPITAVQTFSLGASGGTWEIKFPLQWLTSDPLYPDYNHLKDFLDNSVFNFPLTPCCTGEAIPTYTLEWDINPYKDEPGSTSILDSRSCDDCWIPIASTSGSIHLMCPGCVTPGVIVDWVHLQRATYGWPDDNNNGLANSSGAPYADMDDVIARGGYPYAGSYFMPGDNLTCDIEAHGQDGDNTIGFDYATLRTEWGSHTPVPEFAYLTVWISDLCLANWEINTANTTLSINGGSSININTFKHGSSTSTEHIYNIPYSALGVSGYDVSDVYNVHFDYRVCTNAAPADCDHTVVIWWSTVVHNITDASMLQQAGEPNAALPSSYTATTRANDLVVNHPNLRWYCEGNGAMVHGFQIKKTYTSRWSNYTLSGSYWSVNTCRKLCSNTLSLKLIDVSPGNNFFMNEYRPIDPHFIYDDYLEPPVAPPNYVYDNTICKSRTNTYNSSGLSFAHLITNTSTIPETVTRTSGRMNFLFTSTAPSFNIARDGSLPFTTFPSPERTYDATDGNFYMGDENTELILNHYYKPDACPSTTGSGIVYVSNVGNYARIEDNACLTAHNEDLYNVPTPDYGLKKTNPTLALRLDGTTITVFKVSPTCFNVILKNISAGNEIAENAFLYIPAPFPASTINSVTWVAGVSATCTASGAIVPGNYWMVNIPSLKKTESCTLTVCFTLDPCVYTSAFNFPLTFGYSCKGAVHTPADVVGACFSDELILTPHPAKVIVTGRIDYPTTIARCSTASILADYWVTDIGEVDNIHLFVTLPTGASVMSSSAFIGVPSGYGITVPILSITPIYDSPSPGFTTYDIMLPSSILLPLGPAAMARVRFTIEIGACITGSITPQIRLLVNAYCGNDIYFPALSSPPSSHSITVSGASGPNCIPITISLLSKTDATCLGKNNGSIYIKATFTTTPSPGFGVIHYHWSNGVSGVDHITGLAPGTYTITVTDIYGCEQTATYTISALTNPIVLPIITYQPYTTCELISVNNKINFTPGAGTYKYEWTATNIATGSPSTGMIPPGGPYTFNLDFNNTSLGSDVIIKVIDNTTPSDPNPCYDLLKVLIEPCCDRPEILISNSTAVVEFSSSPSIGGYYDVSGTNYRVNGILNLNHDVTFSGVTFYMQPFSQIRVNSGFNAKFKGCVLVACNATMWKGIVSENTSTVLIEGTRVYDALAGVTTIGNGTYTINNVSNFNRNYIDIDVGPLSGVINTSSITNSNLFCSTESFEYFGNSSNPGKLWYPYRDSTTFIGINVRNNKELTIGASGLLNINNISDKHFGIYSVNSAINVINNHFNNMIQTPAWVTTGGSGPAGAADAINFGTTGALSAYAKNLFADHNVFTNPILHACIYLYGSETQATIQNNTMNGTFGILSNNLGTHYIATIPTYCDYKPINIKANTINYSSGGAGIKLENTSRIEANIDVGNNITGPTFDPFVPNSFGIYISSLSTMSRDIPRFSIVNNYVNNGRVGITAQNIVPYTGSGGTLCGTYTNTIRLNNVKNTDPTVSNYVGIGLANAHNIKIGCNVVFGITGFVTDAVRKNQAILLNESRGNLVSCNDMDKLYRGFSYIGDCSMPNQLAGNNFHDLGTHIYTNGVGYKIGDQVNISGAFPANQMTTIPFVPGRFSIFNGGDPYFFARRALAPHNPLLAGNLGGIMDVLHVPLTPLPPTSDYSCFLPCFPPPAGMPPGEGDSSGMMMEGGGPEEFAIQVKKSTDMDYSEDEEGTKRLNEELLYSILKNDTSLLENDTLEEFYDEKTGEHTGKLSEIKELINNEEYTEATAKLTILPLSNEAEEANKAVYEILNKIEQREKYILTDDEIEILQTIAEYCPVKYGQAVFSARVLISTQYGYEGSYWNDDVLCSADIGYRRANPNQQSLTDDFSNNDFTIYPNPASTELNFKVRNSIHCSDVTNTKIEILDVLGNVVIKKEFEGFMQNGKLNITILANGAYIIKYSCGSNEIYRESFVVNK